LPAGFFFGEVAGDAGSVAVVEAGRAAFRGGVDVVGVSDGCLAPGCSADLVAERDEPLLAHGEEPSLGVHGDEVT
jgi:hypothetical protein